MEIACEFCVMHSPTVYCESDAAFLCLSCDAKVHSANPLSNRHFRTLVCESCKEQPAYVRCADHQMLLCQECDMTLHDQFNLLHHQKHMISSYNGCPSAKQFAVLCGFEVDEMEDSYCSEKMSRFGVSSSQIGVTSLGFPPGPASTVVSLEPTLSSGSQHNKIVRKNHLRQQQNTCLIKQQMIDLQKFQLHRGCNNIGSPLIRRRRQQQDTSSVATTPMRLNDDNNIITANHNSKDLTCLCKLDNPNPELKGGCFLSPMSDQWDQYYATEDPFWQYKSYIDHTQFWSQSCEELHMCDELIDDLNIPDVDVTFHNFEELFAGRERELLEDFDATSCLSFKKHDKSDNL